MSARRHFALQRGLSALVAEPGGFALLLVEFVGQAVKPSATKAMPSLKVPAVRRQVLHVAADLGGEFLERAAPRLRPPRDRSFVR